MPKKKKPYKRKERISVYVPLEVKNRMVDYAERLGLSLTGIASMCITAGLIKIIEAVTPPVFFTEEENRKYDFARSEVEQMIAEEKRSAKR